MKLLLILLLYIPFNCGFQNETLEPKYHIILGIGDSYMAGTATLSTQDSGSGAWLWNNTAWEKADGALNRYAYWGLAYGLGSMNSFGKEAAKHSRPYSIGLVVNGIAGATVQEWKTRGFLSQSVLRALAAKASGTGNEITAVFVQIGANNANTPELFTPHARYFRHYIDSIIGYNTPMIFGGVLHKPSYQAINDTIKKVTDIHDCYYVSSDGLTSTDNVHFDSQSQRIFGLRFYAKYSQIQ